MFRIESGPVCGDTLRKELAVPQAGGCAIFEGWVRNSNEGRAVDRLDYEAYQALGEREGNRILEEARQRYGVSRCLCVHRVGELAIGDLAVWVGVSAPHRGAAFAACRYIIDEIKSRVPIWKKEHYTQGDTEWVNCAQCAGHDHALEDALYSRQMRLPGVGKSGQQALKASSVLVVGAGGLGSPALAYLAGAGIGRIGLCEHGVLDTSDLHRQPLYELGDVGDDKALLARRRLATLNPFVAVDVHATRASADNLDAMLADYDLVLDCTDDNDTRYAINDAAVRARKPAIFASVGQREGRLQVVAPARQSACLRCERPASAASPEVGAAEAGGLLGAVPGILGAMQATEAVKQLLQLDGHLHNEVVLLDVTSMTMNRVRVQRNPACPACGIETNVSDPGTGQRAHQG